MQNSIYTPNMKDLHQIQRKILYDLLFTDDARFKDIKPLALENSQFMFHIKVLIDNNLVEKKGNYYHLTPKGKEFANRMTTETLSFDRMVKTTTVLVAKRKRNENEFLLYKRLKNPFYGCIGFPTEKPKWGETLVDAAKRGLFEEANLKAQPMLFSIKHYIINKNNEVVEDKHMHAFLFNDPTGKLVGNNEGEYFWVPESKIKKDSFNYLEEFWDFYKELQDFTGEVKFAEYKIDSQKF